jgi:hypothetical protein
MLVPKEMLMAACELDPVAMRAALSLNGHLPVGDIQSVEFQGFDSGTGAMVYEVKFDTGLDELITDQVWVRIRRRPLSRVFEIMAYY